MMTGTGNFLWLRTAPALAASLLLLAGCVSPAGPVEAIRFVSADRAAELGSGPITIEPAPRMEADSLEYRTYAAAVARELARVGYRLPLPGEKAAEGSARAAIGFDRSVKPVMAGQSPVSVGVGGGTGGGGSGVGLGVGFNLGGRPKDMIVTELRVVIRAADGAVLWEGRSSVEAKEGTQMADSSLNAAKLAEGLFQGFPGESGETIRLP